MMLLFSPAHKLFQVLLKPIVSQIVVEPPTSTHVLLDIPTVEEVDETVVLCLGQMAVTARSDVLWKPLNHEVSMKNLLLIQFNAVLLISQGVHDCRASFCMLN